MRLLLFHLAVAVLLLAVVVADEGCPASQDQAPKRTEPPNHVSVILIGATGDLAKKYLWRGLYDLFQEHYKPGESNLSIYGCARKDPEEGRSIISDIMLSIAACSDQVCRSRKTKFIEHVQYHQLSSNADYIALNEKITENTRGFYAITDPDLKFETGRIVYLSIPPSAYAKTAKLVNKYLRPTVGKQKPWLRVVFEKPFGHDSESAKELAKKLGKYFSEDEIYRIDHYLGKPAVQHILPFRVQNRVNYEPLWNGRHIERVEIVMKEALDVRGRTSFYNDVGIIRDVMQNHLTEILALVAMDLPKDSGKIAQMLEQKVKVLKRVTPMTAGSVIIGQYETYAEEARNELKQDNLTTSTLTFAAAAMYINNARWKGVPFILLSGKKLDVKASYVRISFKYDKFCMGDVESKSCYLPKQLIFHIGGNNVNLASSLIVSKSLPAPVDILSWSKIDQEFGGKVEFYGQDVSNFNVYRPKDDRDAYSSLISAVYSGGRHRFVDTDSLMVSWDLWSPVLKRLENKEPVLYRGGDNTDDLSFTLTGNQLKFVNQPRSHTVHKIEIDGGIPAVGQIPISYRDQPLVTGTQEKVIAKLAQDLLQTAENAIQEKGVFHVGFSGGTSPIKLFTHLVQNYYTFPWQQTHIWIVDERCLPLDDSKSNYNMIQTHLLNFIEIPHSHVHRMPVDLGYKSCDPLFYGDLIFEHEVQRFVKNNTFDFILLGLGNDGHTASLFPNQESLTTAKRTVLIASGGPESVSKMRMTFTLNLINYAHKAAVLTMGKGKHDIIMKLANFKSVDTNYPITLVVLQNGQLTWYIDHDALFGER